MPTRQDDGQAGPQAGGAEPQTSPPSDDSALPAPPAGKLVCVRGIDVETGRWVRVWMAK